MTSDKISIIQFKDRNNNYIAFVRAFDETKKSYEFETSKYVGEILIKDDNILKGYSKMGYSNFENAYLAARTLIKLNNFEIVLPTE